jgi:hypothetical protein
MIRTDPATMEPTLTRPFQRTTLALALLAACAAPPALAQQTVLPEVQVTTQAVSNS